MSEKFIPNGDQDFLTKAEKFARAIAAEPEKFHITQSDSDALSAAVAKFREVLQANLHGGRSRAGTEIKKQARADAVKIMRRLSNLIRSNDRLDTVTKMHAGIQQRQKNVTPLPCPNEPPRLRFVRAHHETSHTPMHELSFQSLDYKSRPEGAVRLELFVDLIPPDEELPSHPRANHGSRPWYLRSYTRSPIKLTPPMARVPMRVVYWARWADSLGNVGPFSATAVAWIEGGSHALLPGGTGYVMGSLSGRKNVPMIEDATTPGPAGRDPKYIVAVLEAQFQSLNPQQIEAQFITTVLPAPAERETRQIEGPAKSEAA